MINEFTSQVITGSLLGDCYARVVTKQNKNSTARLIFKQSEKNLNYLKHLLKVLQDSNLVQPLTKLRKQYTTPSKFVPKSYVIYEFETKTLKNFNVFVNNFYQNNVKIVPKNIYALLTPISIAYWYMDDGALKSKESKGLIFCTDCFTIFEVFYLCHVLRKKFKLLAWPLAKKRHNVTRKVEPKSTKKNDQKLDTYKYQLYISGNFFEEINNLIGDSLIDSMKEKKWNNVKSQDSKKRSSSNLKPSTKGRYKKVIVHHDNQTYSISEQIYDDSLQTVLWEITLNLKKNNDQDYLTAYNETVKLENCKYFKDYNC